MLSDCDKIYSGGSILEVINDIIVLKFIRENEKSKTLYI